MISDFLIVIDDGVVFGFAFGCRVHASREGTVIIILERKIMVIAVEIINVGFGIVIVIVVIGLFFYFFGTVVVVVVVNCEGTSTYTTLLGQTLSGVRVLDTDTAVGTVIVMS